MRNLKSEEMAGGWLYCREFFSTQYLILTQYAISVKADNWNLQHSLFVNDRFVESNAFVTADWQRIFLLTIPYLFVYVYTVFRPAELFINQLGT